MRILLTLLLLAANFPSTSQTSWMRPESFRLAIGMPRGEALQVLSQGGWEAKPGRDASEIVVDYAGDKSLTLEFQKDRLRSIRFELFAFIPESRKAFAEEHKHLIQARGKAKKATNALLVYDEALPNVMVVLADDPKSDYGKKGLGLLAIRYYDPR
jgi:hypothetical protein